MKIRSIGRPRTKWKKGRCVYCLRDLPYQNLLTCRACGYREDRELGKVD